MFCFSLFQNTDQQVSLSLEVSDEEEKLHTEEDSFSSTEEELSVCAMVNMCLIT